MDDRVTASAFTDSETTSSRRDTSAETETRPGTWPGASGTSRAAAASVIGASIWDSDNRWLTIHGTNYLVVRDCVGYKSVGHGFFLEDGTEVFYQMSSLYASGHARGARWDDPALGIEWPAEPTVVSDRDRTWPALPLRRGSRA